MYVPQKIKTIWPECYKSYKYENFRIEENKRFDGVKYYALYADVTYRTQDYDFHSPNSIKELFYNAIVAVSSDKNLMRAIQHRMEKIHGQRAKVEEAKT